LKSLNVKQLIFLLKFSFFNFKFWLRTLSSSIGGIFVICFLCQHSIKSLFFEFNFKIFNTLNYGDLINWWGSLDWTFKSPTENDWKPVNLEPMLKRKFTKFLFKNFLFRCMGSIGTGTCLQLFAKWQHSAHLKLLQLIWQQQNFLS